MTLNISISSTRILAVRHRILRGSVGIALVVTTMTLAGCVVGPDHIRPKVAVSEHWSGKLGGKAVSAVAQSDWWTSMKDPVLDRVMILGMTGNLGLEAARQRVIEARATYRQTTGSDAPYLDGSASFRRSKSDEPEVFTSQFQTGLDAGWELDLFGGNVRSREAAGYAIEVAAEEVNAAHVTLAGDIATNYVNARGYQARIALARRTAASQRKTLELTQNKLDAGAASYLEVVNARGLVASTEANVPELETAYAQTVHRLGILTGQDPSSLVAAMKTVRPVPSVARMPDAGVPADILAMRPDLRAAERAVAKANAGIGIARANRYPSINLTGSISTSSAKIGDLARASTIGWSFGPSVAVPIFDGGRLAAAEDVARSQKDQTLTAYRTAVIEALEEVENALVSAAQERRKRQKIVQSARAYEEAVKLTKVSYEDGASDFFDVVASERSLYSAQDALIRSNVAIASAYISLNKALGGGWDNAMRTTRK